MPPSPATDTRHRLHAATLRVIVEHGPNASVRSIARAAGVTEGALYRYYDGREALISAVFDATVRPMIAEKENLVAMQAPTRDRLREWVRCTYACFDDDPDTFAFVFLTDLRLPEACDGVAWRQSELLHTLIEQGVARGELREVATDLAVTLFVGMLLSVPTRLRAGRLRGTASGYTDGVAEAAWKALGRARRRAAR